MISGKVYAFPASIISEKYFLKPALNLRLNAVNMIKFNECLKALNNRVKIAIK